MLLVQSRLRRQSETAGMNRRYFSWNWKTTHDHVEKCRLWSAEILSYADRTFFVHRLFVLCRPHGVYRLYVLCRLLVKEKM